MPARLAPTGAYVIVNRQTWRTVFRHPSLADARAAWRRRAFPTKGLVEVQIGGGGAHTHMILPAGAAETAARRRAADAAKKERHA